MNKLKIIIKSEYLTEIKSKSFWIATFLVPVIMIGFGAFGGFMMSESDSLNILQKSASPQPDPNEITGAKLLGMMMGIFLTMFIMMYGSQIFNKVKVEKCNRIMEVLATCVEGRTMMLAKIISVGLVGMTQILIWIAILAILIGGVAILYLPHFPWHVLTDYRIYVAILWSVLFFAGGYVFYGSLFAAVGAMTDKNNENQEYVAVLTFILLGSFYIGEFAVDHATSTLSMLCSYIPFTSATVGCVNAITGEVPVWQSVLSVISLFVCAGLALSISGKIYTSSLLLKGKKFTPKDILVFIKSK